VSSTHGSSTTLEGPDTSAALEAEQRLSGDVAALDDFAQELTQLGGAQQSGQPSTIGRAVLPGRINADEATLDQGLAKLVLTLIELLRRLLEKQAMRRRRQPSAWSMRISTLAWDRCGVCCQTSELDAATAVRAMWR
jgi:hypothetical protein